jgi:acid phosphatase family membrane protein YuiD
VLPFVIAPFFGWLVAGSLKFAINTLRSHGPAWKQIGYGGMPSTHTTIVSTTALLIGLREGWNTPSFAAASALAFIVMLDAVSLRGQIGAQARLLNALLSEDATHRAVRERIGHHWTEVLGGLFVGLGCALFLYWIAANGRA